MTWAQQNIRLAARPRGCHIVTREVQQALSNMPRVQVGLLHLFLQHTSAALTINENADPDVRVDMEAWANRAVPDGAAYFQHVLEGPDDMSAHIKSSLSGVALSIPVSQGALALGTWQGIYLWEFRDHASSRSLVLTLQGQS